MKVTLLDEQGEKLSDATSHLGRSSGQMLVDWATRPDALFQYYFDRRRRAVTAVIGAATWSAVLGTRWQKGARCWFLHDLLPAHALTQAAEQARFAPDSAPGGSGTRRFRAVRGALDLDTPAVASASEPRGVPF